MGLLNIPSGSRAVTIEQGLTAAAIELAARWHALYSCDFARSVCALYCMPAGGGKNSSSLLIDAITHGTAQSTVEL